MSARKVLRAWRLENRLSQVEAGKRAGIPQGVWSLIEQGARRPTLDQAFRIAAVTGSRPPASAWAKVPRRLRVAGTEPPPPPESGQIQDPNESDAA